MVIFNKTTQGFHHIERERVCEDFSGSYSEESGDYHIIAVADGHGDSACFRSNIGSEKAVEVAIKCMKTFTESAKEQPDFFNDLDRDPRKRNTVIKNLTDSVIAEWCNEIDKYDKENPITEEEAGEYFSEITSKDIDLHVYGTTLIAGVWVDDHLLIIQQGDGRCVVFYEDGSADQPVPWDDSCSGNVTTSMCEIDATTRIRSCLLNVKEKKVIACVMGSDGVEDAYADTYEAIEGMHTLMGGVYTFYKNLLCKLCNPSEENGDSFDDYLESMLPDFSKSGLFSAGGSGDDFSVAGIVDVEAVRKHTERFSNEIALYDLENKLFVQRAELNGKLRKHEILKKRLEESKKEFFKYKEEEEEENSGEDEGSFSAEYLNAKEAFEMAQSEFTEYDKAFKEIETSMEETEKEMDKFRSVPDDGDSE